MKLDVWRRFVFEEATGVSKSLWIGQLLPLILWSRNQAAGICRRRKCLDRPSAACQRDKRLTVRLGLSVRLHGLRLEFVADDSFVSGHPCVVTRLDDIGVSGDEVELGTVVVDHVQRS